MRVRWPDRMRGRRRPRRSFVGQNTIEEIDVITAGGNYGWRVFEGTRCRGLGPAPCATPGFFPPVAQYGHSNGRCSTTGGYVYRGRAGSLPAGAYVSGDFCPGEIFLLQGGSATLLLDTQHLLVRRGRSGEVYVVDLRGAVHRLVNR
jgi:hypothetical protein